MVTKKQKARTPVLVNGEPGELEEETGIPQKRLTTGGVQDHRLIRKIREDMKKLGWKEPHRKGYVKCDLCGRKVERRSSSQRYCGPCAKVMKRARTALRVYRHRHKDTKPHRTKRGEIYLFMPYKGRTVAVMIPALYSTREKALAFIKSHFNEQYHAYLFAQLTDALKEGEKK